MKHVFIYIFMQIFVSFMKEIKATNMLQLYTTYFNLLKMEVQYQFFQNLMVQMFFSQIQQAPGPDFRMVGKSLLLQMWEIPGSFSIQLFIVPFYEKKCCLFVSC